jgi:PAS domain S-box-containing protein
MYIDLEETGEKKEWQIHTISVKEEINRLLRHGFHLESINRGYALSKDSIYIKDFNSRKAELSKTLEKLEFLVKDNTSQMHRTEKLKALYQQKFLYMDSLRSILPGNDVISTEIKNTLSFSKTISDEIEDYCKLMLVEEDVLLKMREESFEKELASNKESLLGLIIGLLLIFVVVTFILFQIISKLDLAKKEADSKNLKLEQTQKDLLKTNDSLQKLSSQFESSLLKSKVAAFDWPDTSKEQFWLSDSMFEMLNITKEDFQPSVRAFFSNLMHPEDSEAVQKSLEEHLKNGATYNPEYRLKEKNGGYRYFRALGSSSTKNGIQSMTGVIIDIQEEMELRVVSNKMTERIKEYALRFDLVLEGSSYGVWDWFDTRNSTQWWSDTFYKLIDYSPEEIESNVENFHQLLHPEDREITQKSIEENIANGERINLEYRLNTKNHGYKWFRAVGSRIIDNNEPNRIRMIGVVSDISKEKMFSEELKRSNADLQDFAYVASHDLQEPLRKIQAFGDRLKIHVEKNYPDFDGIMYINKMNDSATRMRVLIDDLLNFSRVSSESSYSDEVDLNEVLEDVKSILSETIESDGANVNVGLLPILKEANRGNMVQLFQNLISNGIKFKKEGTKPLIEVLSERINVNDAIEISPLLNLHENYYRIEIRDNGIGFDETYLKKIFTIFQRLHGRSEYKGTGIGLAVCQKICENHDGYITAKSKEGEGATFIIILPEIKTSK